MTTENQLLQRSIEVVDRERSRLRTECSAFAAFRESVRLAPVASDEDAQSAVSVDLRRAYRAEVMDATAYESTYGDSLAESLRHELSPTLADLLVSGGPLTKRRKRQLLVATTDAIERREVFAEQLADERSSLEAYATALSDVRSAVQRLPECSLDELEFDSFIRLWGTYDSLLERCERLLKRRQRELGDVARSPSGFDDFHALNGYLYRELDSPFPVLSTIAEVRGQIETRRDGGRTKNAPRGPQ